MPNERWGDEYQSYLDNPPKQGDVLEAFGGEPALLEVEVKEGAAPFIYGRAYVPEIVGAELGWYLRSDAQATSYGWKCVLLPKAREDAIRRLGLREKTLYVKSLRVVRPSKTGKSLLCEVAEFLPDPNAAANETAAAIASI
jgi:hypothetical protein